MKRAAVWPRHFSAKLILAFILLITIPITLISSLFYRTAADVIAGNVRQSAKQTARQATDSLETVLTAGMDVAQQLLSDVRIQDAITRDLRGNLTTDDRIEINDLIKNTLDNVMFHNSFVQSIYIFKDEGTQWGSGLFSLNKVERHRVKEQAWYLEAKKGGNRAIWLPIGYDLYSGGGDRTVLVMPLVKGLADLATLRNVGVLMVNLDGKLILDKFNDLSLGKTGRFFVVDEQGTVVIDPRLENVGTSILSEDWAPRIVDNPDVELEFEWRDGRSLHYFIARKIANGWTVVGTVPTDEIIGDISRIRGQTWLYGLLFSLIAVATAFYISRKVTEPLKRLMRQMKKVEMGDLGARVTVDSRDEFGQLGYRFNVMIGQIEELIRRISEEELQKKEAELRALRYQINPHFLYNTLTSIRWLAKYGRGEEAFRALGILAQLLESIMGKDGPMTSLRDEIDLLHKYMEIHRFRYDKPISLHVDCPEPFLGLKVPRMLLQPLVENAVFHGIAPLEGDGEIRLAVRGTPQAVEIRVEDNGVGMTEEQAARLLTDSDRRSGLWGIGLRHVHELIRLYWGERSGLTVESEPGRGTRVVLTMRMDGETGTEV